VREYEFQGFAASTVYYINTTRAMHGSIS